MSQLQQIYFAFTKDIPNYRVRDSQLQMIMKIDECFSSKKSEVFDGSNIALIEAPTGTGKSLAYLLAGVVNANKLGKKLVVATATKALQSQLVEKDIPSLQKYSDLKFTYTLAKGRSSYLCPYQLDLLLQNFDEDIFNDEKHEQLKKIHLAFIKKAWNGDLDLSPVDIDYKLKANIITDKDRCLSYSCSYNQKDECNCPYYLNREKLKSSDVIITNHSLLLVDIALGCGSVLPVKPSEYLLCIDEGHNLSDNAISGFSKSFELKRSLGDCHNLLKLVYDPQTKSYLMTNITKENISVLDKTIEYATDLIDFLEEMLQLVSKNTHLFVSNQVILNDYLNPQIGNEFRDRFVNLAYISSELHARLVNITEMIKESLKGGNNSSLENNLNRLGFYTAVVENVSLTSSYIINQDDSRHNANAKWIELKSNGGTNDFIINASLTHVGDILLSKLWEKAYATLITSATLAIGNDFSYYLYKFGLNKLTKVKTHKLATSFEYNRQAQIVVPRFKSSPEFAGRNLFNKELSEYLLEHLNYTDNFGTLVLFFNRNSLQETYSMLPRGLQQKILSQIDFVSSQRLLDKHKKNIDNGKPSIIFGLNSFAEGVDLPSIYCIHVIITKLPFETHKDPRSMVQEYWVKYEKGNYFSEVSLPEACIRLIQASGRLIRDENDYGQVTICDNRIVTKSYGILLLNALPPFNRKYNNLFISESFNKISKL